MKSVFMILGFYAGFIACIENGQDARTQTSYPFYIMIGNPHICGGTLISYDPALILTAAHCVDADRPTKKDESPYFALYNDIHRDKQRAVAIADWDIHPLYNVSGTINIHYDAAIVRLEKPLRKSQRTKRVPLWSPHILPNPQKGELIGFGYENTEGQLAQTLQTVNLDITSIDKNGLGYIESRTDNENSTACHGDSGGPLIVSQNMTDPSTNTSVTVPFVLGDLTRIFGARDENPDKVNCPVPVKNERVTQIFTNIVALLDWISTVSGISKENLTDPFYNPPCRNCNQKTGHTSSKGTDEDDEDDRHVKWSIGVVADENGLLDTDTEDDNLRIGSMMTTDSYLKASPEDSSSTIIESNIIYYITIAIVFYIYSL